MHAWERWAFVSGLVFSPLGIVQGGGCGESIALLKAKHQLKCDVWVGARFFSAVFLSNWTRSFLFVRRFWGTFFGMSVLEVSGVFSTTKPSSRSRFWCDRTGTELTFSHLLWIWRSVLDQTYTVSCLLLDERRTIERAIQSKRGISVCSSYLGRVRHQIGF